MKASDNVFPKLLIVEGAAPSSPPASDFKLYVDSSDHLLKMKNSAGTVTTFGAGMTDPMTTRGDIIIRNSSNVTARLGIGASGTFLKSDGTDISWQASSGGLAQSYLGYNTIGGTWTTVTINRYYNKKFTLSAAAFVMSVDVYLRPSTDSVGGMNVVITNDNSNAPGVLVARGPGGTGAANSGLYLSNSGSMPGAGRWVSTPIGAYLPSGDYWAGVQPGVANWDIANDASGSDQIFTTTGGNFIATGAYPTAWALSDSTLKYSIRISILG